MISLKTHGLNKKDPNNSYPPTILTPRRVITYNPDQGDQPNLGRGYNTQEKGNHALGGGIDRT